MAAPLPQAVKLMLASQDHRLKHYIWHGVRNSWLQMSVGQRQAILALYPGWDVKIRASAAGSLALLGSAAKEAIPELILALRDENLLVRQNATSALVILGDDAVPGLVEDLKEKDPVIRAAAAETLGKIGSQKALSTRKAALLALIKAMGDENERVRKAATQAYEIIKTRGQADP